MPALIGTIVVSILAIAALILAVLRHKENRKLQSIAHKLEASYQEMDVKFDRIERLISDANHNNHETGPKQPNPNPAGQSEPLGGSRGSREVAFRHLDIAEGGPSSRGVWAFKLARSRRYEKGNEPGLVRVILTRQLEGGKSALAHALIKDPEVSIFGLHGYSGHYSERNPYQEILECSEGLRPGFYGLGKSWLTEIEAKAAGISLKYTGAEIARSRIYANSHGWLHGDIELGESRWIDPRCHVVVQLIESQPHGVHKVAS